MTEERQKGIGSIVKTYGAKLFGFIRNKVNNAEDAEDILQDVWYQLSNTVNLDEIEQVSGWLFHVARNKIIDRYRKKKTTLIDDFTFEDEDGDFSFKDFLLMSNSEEPDRKLLGELFWSEFEIALAELPEKQRQVFIRNELEDMTLQEIADTSGEPLKTIISRKGYAVKYLRNRLRVLYNEIINY